MIDNTFELKKILGKGGSSKVFLATDAAQMQVAIKTMRKDKKYSQQVIETLVKREADMLSTLEGHPNIIRCMGSELNGTFTMHNKSEPVVYNVLEYAENGAFSAFVRSTGPIEEQIARLFTAQVCSAVNHMHSLGYAHLDIKLENILLDGLFNAKLADLGSCIEAPEFDTMVNRRRGTLSYMAPEVANLESGQSFMAIPADIYSLGVTIYVMVTGEFPSAQMLKKNVSTSDCDAKTSCDVDMDDEESNSGWNLVSSELKDLLQSMTHPDPYKRPSMLEVLSHPWVDCEFSQELMQEAYQEMSSRKAYIKTLSNSRQ
ncbi:unnamed protein product [Moneuplotes crassus]|uniref:Protein kinase domain-containing protein n=1 Tax=Euplotes crassus TaxID=5936 RepID=A0AAD1Y0H6_EUPCR|nr:unnamed protein product [Moneuplotes crassus]